MKLNKKFTNKISKVLEDNEIILLKEKNIKQKNLKALSKQVFSSKLFAENNFLIKNQNNKTYIFVNCLKSKTSLEFEKLGSKLYVFLNNNKIENAFVDIRSNSLTNVQIEKFLHGAQLKSYNFNLYKSNKKKNSYIDLNVVGNKNKKTNILRNKLNALLQGVFLTRDLVSEPGNILHPDEYAKRINSVKNLG